jgi:hypothetical protein
MFVETRTTVAEVLADVQRELGYAAMRVAANVRTKRVHPTFVTKVQIRESLSELTGAFIVTAQVLGGSDKIDADVLARVAEAREMAKTVL